MATNPKLAWLKGPPRKTASSASPAPRVGASVASNAIYQGGIKDPSGRTVEFSSKEDKCPVCTTDRYLNPKLRLLVSPCYHKMCESCIDRLFTLGPAACPTCGKILRKMQFTAQTFEDLGVEKEVAVRRRMAKEFNKRREDFPDLRSYNDYLEEVEDITFNLINNIDIPQTEARIDAFRRANRELIELNIQRDERDAVSLQEEEDRARAAREEAAREARLADEAEREEIERERRRVIEGLEKGETAEAVIARSRAEAAARARRAAAAGAAAASARPSERAFFPPSNTPAIPDPPHTILIDSLSSFSDRYTILPSYDDPPSEAVRRDVDGIYRAGGYRIEEAWERAVRCAVIGLGVGVVRDDEDAMVVDPVA